MAEELEKLICPLGHIQDDVNPDLKYYHHRNISCTCRTCGVLFSPFVQLTKEEVKNENTEVN